MEREDPPPDGLQVGEELPTPSSFTPPGDGTNEDGLVEGEGEGGAVELEDGRKVGLEEEGGVVDGIALLGRGEVGDEGGGEIVVESEVGREVGTDDGEVVDIGGCEEEKDGAGEFSEDGRKVGTEEGEEVEGLEIVMAIGCEEGEGDGEFSKDGRKDGLVLGCEVSRLDGETLLGE